MPFRFQKRIPLAKGVHLNVSKKGLTSISAGPRGAKLSTGKRGTRVSLSAPGTGLSKQKKVGAGCLLPVVLVALAFGAALRLVGG